MDFAPDRTFAAPPPPEPRRWWWGAALTALLGAAAVAWLEPRPARAAPPAVAAAIAAADETTAPRKATHGRVNLNTATAEQLERLPGIGPAKAERIIAFRTRHGPFKRVVDLRRVKGFGRKTLKRLEPFLDVQGPTTLEDAEEPEPP